jgi:hypothetical protein
MRHASFVFTLLVVILTATMQAQAGHKLYVGSLSLTQGFTHADDTILPPTDLEDIALDLPNAYEGTPDAPGASLPVSFQLGVINPDPGGFANAGFFDVYYDGTATTFPSSSVFDLFVDFTHPGTTTRKKGGIKKLDVDGLVGPNTNAAIRTEAPTGLVLETLFTGNINSLQPGLAFADPEVVQGTSPDPFATSFFDILFKLEHDGSGLINPNLPLFRVTVTPIPEPSTLLLASLAGLLFCSRRRAHPLYETEVSFWHMRHRPVLFWAKA